MCDYFGNSYHIKIYRLHNYFIVSGCALIVKAPLLACSSPSKFFSFRFYNIGFSGSISVSFIGMIFESIQNDQYLIHHTLYDISIFYKRKEEGTVFVLLYFKFSVLLEVSTSLFKMFDTIKSAAFSFFFKIIMASS